MKPRLHLPFLLWLAFLGFIPAIVCAQKVAPRPKLDPESIARPAREALFTIKSSRSGLTAAEPVLHHAFFISPAGHAVCSLHAFDGGAYTATFGPENIPVRIESVLVADYPSGLAIVSTNQRPKTVLPLPTKAVAMRDEVILLREVDAGGALLAPILARRKAYQARSGKFSYALSIGVNLGPRASRALPAGSPLLDRNGVVAGCISGPSLSGNQRLLLAIPGNTLTTLAAKLTQKPPPVALPLPLPPFLQPHDPLLQDPTYIQGRNAQFAADYLSAERLLRKALQQQPESAIAWQRLGLVLRNLGRDKEALHAFEQSAKFAEGVGSFQIMLAEQLRIMERYPAALQVLMAASKADPSDYEVQRAYGIALRLNKEEAAALQHLRLASRLAPDIISNWEVLGKCLGALGQWDEEKLVTTRIYELEEFYRLR